MATKTYISTIPINQGQFYTPFEIKLPSLVAKLTGLTMTSTVADISTTAHIGTVSLQSNGRTDVFVQMELFQDDLGFKDPNETAVKLFSTNDQATWITGGVPQKLSINVEGTTEILSGWYKSYYSTAAYSIKVYLEYEEIIA